MGLDPVKGGSSYFSICYCTSDASEAWHSPPLFFDESILLLGISRLAEQLLPFLKSVCYTVKGIAVYLLALCSLWVL